MEISKEIRNLLEDKFDENDFRTLCFDLELDYDLLNNQGKTAMIQQLLIELEQTNQFDLLDRWLQPSHFGPDHSMLIQLYLAIDNFFELEHVYQIYQNTGLEIPTNTNKMHVIRELLLIIKRRRRISELQEVCIKLNADFAWEDIAIPFKTSTLTKSKTHEQFKQMLIQELDAEYLRQLCFYLDIDFEDIGASYWLTKDISNLSLIDQVKLQKRGINCTPDQEEQLKQSLRKLWSEPFVDYIEKQGKFDQASIICDYLVNEKASRS